MPVAYLDLDGCLVDFVRAALKAHGSDLPISEVRWGFPVQLGFAHEHDPSFWSGFGFGFWSTLPWTPDGRELLALVEDLFGQGYVLPMTRNTSIFGSAEGKIAWIAREMPAYRRQYFVGPPKHLVAGPDKVLVDDSDANVDEFVAHGGWALLVPRPWNRRRGECGPDGSFDVAKFRQELQDVRGRMGRKSQNCLDDFCNVY